MSDHDPAETFRRDQEDAQREEQTREAQAWELNVRSSTSQAMGQEAAAVLLLNKAKVWRAAAALITTAWMSGALVLFLTLIGKGPWA